MSSCREGSCRPSESKNGLWGKDQEQGVGLGVLDVREVAFDGWRPAEAPRGLSMDREERESRTGMGHCGRAPQPGGRGSPECRAHKVFEENGQASKTHAKASPKQSVGG